MIAAAVRQTRKVRAPQGRVLGNTQWRRLQGQCNREIPRMKRELLMRKGGKVR